jgi:predicted nucleic acid-binding protein
VRGLLDTSVFIADEQGRALDTSRLPDEAAASMVTFAELELGVHTASDEATRAQRLRTLAAVQREFDALPLDAAVASVFAELAAGLRRAGKASLGVQDAWIAATACAHAVAVVSQDDDFDDLPGVDVIRV